MGLILGDLLGEPTSDPPELRLEAACELLTVAGAKLDSAPKIKARVDKAFLQFARVAGKERVYPARVRFLVRDVIELRTQHWVARREAFTVRGRAEGVKGGVW